MSRQTLLAELLVEYELQREITTEYVRHIRSSVRRFSTWLGHQATVADFQDRTVNQFLLEYQRRGRAAHTRKNLRNDLLSLWRSAARLGLCAPPQMVRTVYLEPIVPEAWTQAEVWKLIDALPRAVPSKFRTLDEIRVRYFESLIRVAWDTGLRRKNLHSLKWSQVRESGIVVQNKTRRLVPIYVRPSTLESIDKLKRNRECCWPLWGADDTFRQTFAKIVRIAGIPPGPWKKIRKSAGSAAEQQYSGRGHEFLGNTRKVFEFYYLDRRIPDPPRPPELVEDGSDRAA